MDYRERKYFLVTMTNQNETMKKLKELVPTIEFHAPYNHFNKIKGNKSKPIRGKMFNGEECDKYDGQVMDLYIQQMISCRYEYVDKLTENISKTGIRSLFELTKERIHQ